MNRYCHTDNMSVSPPPSLPPPFPASPSPYLPLTLIFHLLSPPPSPSSPPLTFPLPLTFPPSPAPYLTTGVILCLLAHYFRGTQDIWEADSYSQIRERGQRICC